MIRGRPFATKESMDDYLIYLNGINGVTGQGLVAPMSAEEAASLANGLSTDSDQNARFNRRSNSPLQGLSMGLDPTNPNVVDRAGDLFRWRNGRGQRGP